MKLEFQKRILTIEFGEDSYNMNFPSVRQIDGFQREAKKDQDSLSPTIKFLESLGLPKDVSYSLEPDMLSEIISTLSGQKKS